MEIHYGNTSAFLLLALAAASLLVVAYAASARWRALRRFATSNLARELLPRGSTHRHWIRGLLLIAVLCMLALSLVDIRWGKTEQELPQKGIEVMFVLDVSRSMLAEDVSPSRLDRAKQQIADMLDEMSGDRVGLLVFAGETKRVVPLTSHYEDFKQTLDGIGPHSLRRGGSQLGTAIRAAAAAFLDKTQDHKAIVIFTDGEDQESMPIEAARDVYAEQGIRIFTVGLGDMDQGARIPEQTDRGIQQYVEHDGQTVWSKLNGKILSQIATDTGGAYIPAGTKRVNMSEVYHAYIANLEQTEFETARVQVYTPRFQWFAAPALLLLLLEIFLSTRPGSRLPRTSRLATPTSQSVEEHKKVA